MFHSISWQQYLQTIGFLLAGYYSVVGWVFFRHILINNGKGFGPAIPPVQVEKAPAMELLQAVQEAMGALANLIDSASKRNYNKEELLTGITGILVRYPVIKASFFETSINQWTVDRTAAACGLHLSLAELQRCW